MKARHHSRGYSIVHVSFFSFRRPKAVKYAGFCRECRGVFEVVAINGVENALEEEARYLGMSGLDQGDVAGIDGAMEGRRPRRRGVRAGERRRPTVTADSDAAVSARASR